MKLCAQITTDILSRLAAILSACGSEVILHFSETSLSLCIPQALAQVGVWAGSESSSCFNKYQIVSQNSNTVSLKANAGQLAQALNVDSSPVIEIYLSRSEDVLYLQLTHRSLDALKQLEHRVPVILLHANAVQRYAEPEWDPPTMKARFPPLKNVSQWCNNAKGISQYLTILISRKPILENDETLTVEVGLKAENDTVCFHTHFPNLGIADPDDSQSNEEVECEVFLELKKFIKILKVQQLQPQTSIIYIYDKKSIRLHFLIPSSTTNPTTLTYVLNAVSH